MKAAVLILVCCFIVFENGATDPYSKKKILVVGFSYSYFNSNSFESLAQDNSVHEDSIFHLVNGKVLKTFTESLNHNFEYISVDDAKDLSKQVETSIHYLSPSTDKDITSVEIHEEEIKRLCAYYNADMVMFINSYELNWEEEPYLAYVHRLDSEVFLRSGKRIDEDAVTFMTDDVKLQEKYSSKLSRHVGKVLKRLERIDVEADVFVEN